MKGKITNITMKLFQSVKKGDKQSLMKVEYKNTVRKSTRGYK